MRMGIAGARSAGARLTLLAGLLFLVDSSCAKMVPIPEGDYRDTGAGKKATYRLKTKDDRIYEFNRCAVTDSTLIILKGAAYGTTGSLHDATTIRTPVVVPWDNVSSLERCEHDYWNLKIAFAIGASVVIVGYLVYVAVTIYAVATGLSHLD